jgi:hypothetical protein
VENAIKDLNRIHFIVLMIINVIQFLKTIFIVKNVKAVIKGLKINIFIVKNVFSVMRGINKIGFIAINVGNVLKDKEKTIITAKNAIFVSNI